MSTVAGHEAVGGATTRPKADPNVQVPAAVKAAAQRAEELAKGLASPPSFTPPSSASEEVASDSKPSANVQITNYDPQNPGPPAEPAPPTAPEPADWEHQFRSLKGRYDRETEKSRQMNQQIQDMQRLIGAMNAAPPAQEGSGVRFDVPTPQKYTTAKDVQEYGEEFLDLLGRRAREVYEPVVAQLASELQQVKRQVGGVQNVAAYDASVRMYDTLAKEVPNWEIINNSSEFARWLDQVDPISGQIRRDLLGYAHRNNLTARVIAVFKGFLSDLASSGPAYAGSAPGNGAGTPASTPHVDLMQYAAPGRAKAGQTQVSPEKPIINAADISQLYRDKTAGKFAGREDEFRALEKAYIEAGREGRVRR